MRCVECSCYYWDDYEEMEICHADPNWPAPCEYDDAPEEEEEPDFDECGFDPYEGCYTYDC